VLAKQNVVSFCSSSHDRTLGGNRQQVGQVTGQHIYKGKYVCLPITQKKHTEKAKTNQRDQRVGSHTGH